MQQTKEPRYRHADQVEWQEVKVQDHAGRRVAVREKWMEWTPKCLTIVGKWDPGMIVRKHGHLSQQIIYVTGGSMTVGGVECTKGMHIVLEEGAAAGPMIAGPEGVEVFEIMMGDASSWSNDQQAFEDLLAEEGVVALEPPPLNLPDWLKAKRGG
jgi:hypothetical protein